jgi:hypothetical protein
VCLARREALRNRRCGRHGLGTVVVAAVGPPCAGGIGAAVAAGTAAATGSAPLVAPLLDVLRATDVPIGPTPAGTLSTVGALTPAVPLVEVVPGVVAVAGACAGACGEGRDTSSSNNVNVWATTWSLL